ncbi:hypothetical protein [Streptomyces sp. N50]|uniref:hypothetical protein n=1 Tax=Streptomyces sp. N50 TaxID=3081765 RepID=UPI0029620D79|nr:hypothetical protein [Streptomyces sp. N50]WOX11457.1 hypothetical protein R2B38_22660 [Streptomyces sp. N50]
MSWIGRAGHQIRRGENLDAYLTITVSIVLAVLNLAGIVSTEKVLGALLAVLALLATGTLVTRTKLDAMAAAGESAKSPVLITTFPPSHDEDLQGDGDLYLAGVSLTNAVPSILHALERRLRAGSLVRILVIQPSSPAEQLAENRLGIQADHARRTGQTRGTLTHLERLHTSVPGRLEVRVTTEELSFGWTHIAPGTSRATLYLQYYAYKIQRLENMKMVLRPADGQWYDFHLDQLQAFWDNATPWNTTS